MRATRPIRRFGPALLVLAGCLALALAGAQLGSAAAAGADQTVTTRPLPLDASQFGDDVTATSASETDKNGKTKVDGARVIVGLQQPDPSEPTAPAPGPVPAPSEPTAPAPDPGAVVVLRADSNAVAQQKIDAAGAGARITYEAGLHPLRSVTPKPNQVHEGLGAGAVFDGSVTISGWAQSGSTWSATIPGGLTDQKPPRSARFGDIAAQRPEELFRNGVRDRRVETLAEVPAAAKPAEAHRAGKFWIDYANDRVHVGTNPSGATFRLSVTPQAISAIPHPVTVRNITARKYATQLRRGPLGGGFGLADWSTKNRGWTWEDVTVEDNHGSGVVASLGGTLRRVHSVRNGHAGVLASGAETEVDYFDPVERTPGKRGGGQVGDILIEDSVIAHNGQARHDFMWEGGGIKIGAVTDPGSATVRNNHIHHNRVIGLWFDVWSETTRTERNLVEHNERVGVMHELSRGPGTVRDNIIRHNGAGSVTDVATGVPTTNAPATDMWVAKSRNITVERNVFQTTGRGTMYVQTREIDGTGLNLRDVRINGNHFNGTPDGFHSWEGQLLSGGRSDNSRLQLVTADGNQYWMANAWNPWRYGHWQQTDGSTFFLTFAQWQALGLDRNGRIRTDAYRDPAGFVAWAPPR
jgi:hypothetical protein